jgi:tRNA-dihydrouridine synthase 3
VSYLINDLRTQATEPIIPCPRCRFTHDISAYLAAKPKDIHYSPSAPLSEVSPFIQHEDCVMEVDYPSLDASTICPIFSETGECRYGLKCRFLGAHVRRDADGQLLLVQDEDKKARSAVIAREVNFMDPDTLKLLRSKKYPHPITDTYLLELQENGDDASAPRDYLQASTSTSITVAEPEQSMDIETDKTGEAMSSDNIINKRAGGSATQIDMPETPSRFTEKKRLHWAGKTCASHISLNDCIALLSA